MEKDETGGLAADMRRASSLMEQFSSLDSLESIDSMSSDSEFSEASEMERERLRK